MKPINIMIVEDEDLIREHFIHSFPENNNIYKIVAEASNGEEALKICHSLSIDIIITDIVMPIMDGIALTASVKKKFPNIKVILLSCHEQFDFARQALSLGASDYLLKANCSISDLLITLDKVRNDIVEGYSSIVTPTNPLSIFQTRSLLLENILSAQSYLQKGQFQTTFGLKDISTDCCIIQLKVTGYRFIIESRNLDSPASFQNEIMDYIESFSLHPLNAFCFQWQEGRIGLLLCNSSMAVKLEEHTISKFLRTLEVAMKDRYSIGVIFGVSHPYRVFTSANYEQQLIRQLFESEHCVKSLFYYTDQHILYSSQSIPFNDMKKYVSDQLNQMYAEALETQMHVIMTKKIQSIIQAISHHHLNPTDLIKWLLSLTLTSIDDNTLHLEMTKNAAYIDSIHDVESYLSSLIEKQKKHIRIELKSSDNPYIQATLDYIHENYRKKFHIKDISKKLFLSSNYLSHIFKKELGIGIINYLNQIRINYAAHYLANSDIPLPDIALQVGISDYKYFIKLFANTKGITPGEYRKQHFVPS